jgi:hypothetical protein
MPTCCASFRPSTRRDQIASEPLAARPAAIRPPAGAKLSPWRRPKQARRSSLSPTPALLKSKRKTSPNAFPAIETSRRIEHSGNGLNQQPPFGLLGRQWFLRRPRQPVVLPAPVVLRLFSETFHSARLPRSIGSTAWRPPECRTREKSFSEVDGASGVDTFRRHVRRKRSATWFGSCFSRLSRTLRQFEHDRDALLNFYWVSVQQGR